MLITVYGFFYAPATSPSFTLLIFHFLNLRLSLYLHTTHPKNYAIQENPPQTKWRGLNGRTTIRNRSQTPCGIRNRH